MVLNHEKAPKLALASDAAALEDYRRDSAKGDMDAVAVWAGEAIDLITEVQSAADIVAAMVERAEDTLRGILED
jgi:nitronate monooxygenase